jgi:hypothetical protein
VRTITITTGSVSNPPPNTLIKLICPGYAVDANHPCKAVYYIGSDGKRHAFPNEKVYFTWYTGFSGVVEVSDSVMATFALGKNVTYRPGVKMVKFATVPQVYAVTRYGVLRWVKTEALANTLYGSSWNLKIDDISDAFFANYSFGADINSISDYNPSAETASVTTVDQNL